MNSRYSLPLLSVAILCLGATAVRAQTPPVSAPAPSSRTDAATVSLSEALTHIGRAAGVLVVADSTVAQEKVPATSIGAADSDGIEHRISALVRLLPPGTTFAKLYLPEPAKGKSWQGDDVSAYAYAQARLFGTVGANPPAGFLEILGQRLPEAQAKDLIVALHLKPVYLVTNPGLRGQGGDAVEPWAPMTRNQWLGMTLDQQKEFGRQQAQQIMSLSPEQRDQVLKQMKQLDHFLDSVKDPLEHLIGHDL